MKAEIIEVSPSGELIITRYILKPENKEEFFSCRKEQLEENPKLIVERIQSRVNQLKAVEKKVKEILPELVGLIIE